jgi:hypothetical protein
MKRKIFFIFLFLFITELAFGEIYKWVDEKGVVHFTDDTSQIPEKYRDQMERLGSGEEEVNTEIKNESSPQKKEERYQDRAGRGEE